VKPAAIEEIRAVLDDPAAAEDAFSCVAELIRSARDYTWVGIFRVNAGGIAIVSWSGPDEPAYPQFPVRQGLCEEAVRSADTVLADDVTKDPRYLTTFSTTQSEIVVPVLDQETQAVLGLIDVESERANALSEEDSVFLGECATVLGQYWRLRAER